ncbi:MAG: asparagine synthase (glutamine-hydrolyzing) [Clostridiales bacterium]|nr:asparagine synthase (glutamine-hydrolyzing) [Clostridiales bacterium]
MCGICGIVGENNNKSNIINKMMEKIKHRGPDDEGKYFSDEIALGFRRLSIIDLEHGAQPMFNENKDIAIVFNGEIYNYKEIKKELTEKGHIFSSESDTECIIHGYEEYGVNILDHLRGMFAFAIWDERYNKLFATRDFFGIKPFYYSIIDNNLIFSSEIKSILEYDDYKKELNEEALDGYLSFQYSVLEETFFKNIFKLLPGHYLIFQDGKLEIKEYFNPTLEPVKKFDISDSVNKIDNVIKDSINRHLISDVEVGTLLSSGIDSSLVTKEFKGKKTFTVGFNDNKRDYNEVDYAKRLSEDLKKENYSRNINSEEFFNVIPKVMYYMDEPLGDSSAIALYFLNEEASKRIKVVLSGEGADELFGGYNIYKEPNSLAPFRFLPEYLKKSLGKFASKIPYNIKGKNYLIRGSKTLEDRFIGNAYIFSEEEKRKVLKRKTDNNINYSITHKYYNETRDLDEVSKMQYIDLNLWLPGDILLKADKMSMANSIENRVPFLDIEVYKVAKRLNVNEKIYNGSTKLALRQVARKYLPEDVANKKKLGFPVPIRVWIKEEKYYNIIQNEFKCNTAKSFFNSDYLLKLLEDHKNRKTDNSRKIWTIYCFIIWYKVYFENLDIEANIFEFEMMEVV